MCGAGLVRGWEGMEEREERKTAYVGSEGWAKVTNAWNRLQWI